MGSDFLRALSYCHLQMQCHLTSYIKPSSRTFSIDFARSSH